MLKAELVENEDLILKLFKNDLTLISELTTDYLEEADFTNYESKVIIRDGWNPPNLVATYGEATYSETFSWTCGATGNTVYGYWIEDSSGFIIWAEKFPTARNLVNGDILEITPKFRLDSV